VRGARVSRVRLDRTLANLGYGSRSEIRALLAEGRVLVGGVPEKDGARIVRTCEVLLDGEALDRPNGIFALLHKPAGCACSHDPREAPLIYDLLPARWRKRNPKVGSVGRLDRDAAGLIIITDRADLMHTLASPKHGMAKVYSVELAPTGPGLGTDLIPLFASGTLLLPAEGSERAPLREKPCLPAELVITGRYSARLTIREGRFHQVKRMFAACGYSVCALRREEFGPYTLDGLAPGDWRDAEAPLL